MVNTTNSKTKDETRKSQKLCLRAEWHYHEAAGIHAHVDNRRPLTAQACQCKLKGCTGAGAQTNMHWPKCLTKHCRVRAHNNFADPQRTQTLFNVVNSIKLHLTALILMYKVLLKQSVCSIDLNILQNKNRLDNF